MRVYFTVCWVWFKLQLSDLPRFKVYRHIFWRTYTYGRRQAATIAKRSRTTLRLLFLQRTRVDPQKCNVKSKWRANSGQLRDLIIKTFDNFSKLCNNLCHTVFLHANWYCWYNLYTKENKPEKNARNSEKSRKITWGQFTTTGDFCQTFSQCWPICWCCLDRGPGSFDVEDATTLSWSSAAVSEWVQSMYNKTQTHLSRYRPIAFSC